MDYKKNRERKTERLFSVPLIYGMFFPMFVFDICLEIYHQICFRLYGLPLVERAKYIKIDRQKLSYLKWYDKLNCMYCGYANGLVHYATVIAGITEKYWCGIKHAPDENFIPPAHHQDFLEYGDEEGYKKLSGGPK